MPEITRYAPGSFCWIELNTSDLAAAKEFYCALFGWQAEDAPADAKMAYTMLKIGELEIGAMCGLRPEAQPGGAPPHWTPYVTVESADATVAKAAGLGAAILSAASDVMDVGRLAVIQEPQGARFCIWQPKSRVGARLAGENGTMIWNELWSNDTAQSARFYTALFGWEAKESPSGPPGGYVEWQNGGQSIGGMMAINAEMGPMPPIWLPYFMVADCDASAEKAQASGATLCVAPMEIAKVGRFAVIQDPQGAMFAVIKMATGAQ